MNDNQNNGPWGLELFAGLAWIVLGSVALFAPVITTYSAVLVFGWVLTIAGVVQCVSILFNWTKEGVVTFLLGMMTLLFGLLMLSDIFTSTVGITGFIGIMFLMQGAVMLLVSMMSGKANWPLLISGVISIVAALMLLSNLVVSSVFLVGFLLGFQMITFGFGLLIDATFGTGDATTGRKVLGWLLVIIMVAFFVLPALFVGVEKEIHVEEAANYLEAATPTLRYSPEGTIWDYDGGTISFQEGSYHMSFGCNEISGNFSAKRTALTFTQPHSTRKACPGDIAQKESDFSKLIVMMDTYSETNEGAALSGGDKEMLLEK